MKVYLKSFFILLFIFQVINCLRLNKTDQGSNFDEDDYVRRYMHSIRAQYGDQLKETYEQDLTNHISRRKRSFGSSCELAQLIDINSECMCQKGPHKTMVELPMINGDMSGNTLQMPRCVSIERCSSSCSSPKYKCVPTEMKMVKVPVSLVSPGKFMVDVCQLIEVERHTKCDCVCAMKETDCNPQFEVFDKDTCKCVCRIKPHMCASNKKANYRRCECECQVRKECSSGEKFNEENCDCEEAEYDYNNVK